MLNLRDYITDGSFTVPVGRIIDGARDPSTNEMITADAVQFNVIFNGIGRAVPREARNLVVTLQVFEVFGGKLHIIDTKQTDELAISSYSRMPIELTSYLQGETNVVVQAHVTAKDLFTGEHLAGFSVGPINPLNNPVDQSAPKTGNFSNATRDYRDPDNPFK